MYKFAINILVLLCCFLFFGVANAELMLCFMPEKTLSNSLSNLRFSISEYEDGIGFVKYEPSGEINSISRLFEKTISRDKSVPATVKSIWKEMRDEREIGTFILITKGAAVFSLSYKGVDGRKLKFFSDPDCSSDK